MKQLISSIVFFVLTTLTFSLVYPSLAVTETQIAAFCELSTLWGCIENCTIACGVCGATCSLSDDIDSINLSQIWLDYIPESFGNLNTLKILDLSETGLQFLPDSFCNLTALTSLRMHDADLTSLPHDFGKLTSLQYLELVLNSLTTLPASFVNLTSLTHLYLTYNQLPVFPEVLTSITSLVDLSINTNPLGSNHRISVIPDSIGNLVALTGLYIEELSLSTLPESMRNLTRLQLLDMEDNFFTTLPDWFGYNWTSLRKLYLWNNQLTTFPDSLLAMTNISMVSLAHNFLNCSEISLRFGGTIFSWGCSQGLQNKCNYTDISDCIYHLPCHWNTSLSTCQFGPGEPVQFSSLESMNSINDQSSSSQNKEKINNSILNDVISSSYLHQESIAIIIEFDIEITSIDLTQLENEIATILGLDSSLVNVILISSTEIQVTITGQSLTVIQQNANTLIQQISNGNIDTGLLRNAIDAYLRENGSYISIASSFHFNFFIVIAFIFFVL